jgi:large subunit ribosomal protein L17
MVFSYLQDKRAVTELFREISQKSCFSPRWLYTNSKTGFRQGDNAEMCIIEFVDYNETYTTTETKKAAKTRRSRKTTSKTTPEETPQVQETSADVVEETTTTDVPETTPEEKSEE